MEHILYPIVALILGIACARWMTGADAFDRFIVWAFPRLEARLSAFYHRGWRAVIPWIFAWMLFRLANGWQMGDLPALLTAVGGGGAVTMVFGFFRSRETLAGRATLSAIPSFRPADDPDRAGSGRAADITPSAA